MNIFEEVQALGFPEGEFLVVGSAAMAVHGIREANDIDVLVSAALYEKCKNSGWESFPWTHPFLKGSPWLRKGVFEAYLEICTLDGNLSLDYLLPRSESIKGIPFMLLQDLARFKKDYGRPKDLEDVKRIEEYLAKKR